MNKFGFGGLNFGVFSPTVFLSVSQSALVYEVGPAATSPSRASATLPAVWQRQ